MKNYSSENGDVDKLGRRLSAHYAPIIAQLHHSGVSDRDIAVGTGWDMKYNVSVEDAEMAVERARHTKRFMGYLLAEKMKDRRRIISSNERDNGRKDSREGS